MPPMISTVTPGAKNSKATAQAVARTCGPHYDDNMEHTTWLSMMYPRLKLLKKFLREDGFIFVQIDNTEMPYLKIIMDEIFGRNNFVNDIVWKRKGGSVNPKNRLNNMTDYILLYGRSDISLINSIVRKTNVYSANNF